jgi:hypothetical protein
MELHDPLDADEFDPISEINRRHDKHGTLIKKSAAKEQNRRDSSLYRSHIYIE